MLCQTREYCNIYRKIVNRCRSAGNKASVILPTQRICKLDLCLITMFFSLALMQLAISC